MRKSLRRKGAVKKPLTRLSQRLPLPHERVRRTSLTAHYRYPVAVIRKIAPDVPKRLFAPFRGIHKARYAVVASRPVSRVRRFAGMKVRHAVVAGDHRREVLMCVRRKVRRMVMFALGVGGARRSAPGRGGTYRRTPSSEESC